MKEAIWIAFLGKKGGGVNLLRQTEKILGQSGMSTLSLVSKHDNSTSRQPKVISTPNRKLLNLVHLFTFPLMSFKLFFINRKNLPVVLIQVMPSPMDYWLDIWCHLFGVKIFRAIHDFKPHPGELWPTSRAIKRRIKLADEVFVFSTYVSQNLDKKDIKQIRECMLPNEIELTGHISSKLVEKVSQMNQPLILFIGRIKKYKGLEFLLQTLQEYPEFRGSVLIAGEGSIRFEGQCDVHLWNYWLSEAEIDYLLSRSNIVIFPYLEASQSGMIPLAMQKNKVILATDVGSLREQLLGYQNKVLIKSGDKDSLVKGLATSVRMSIKGTPPPQNPKAIQDRSLGNQVIDSLSNLREK